MPDNKSQSLKAFKKGAAKEISRADRLHDLEMYKQKRIYNLRVMDRENSDKEHYRNTWIFGIFVGGLLLLLAVAFFIAVFYEKYEQIEIVISALVFMLGHVTGLLIGRIAKGR